MEKKLVAVLIVIFAIAGLALGYFAFLKPKNDTAVPTVPGASKETDIAQKQETATPLELGESTGDVDEISSGIVSQLQAEENKFSAEDGEASVIIDQSALNDFGQSYNENEF